MIRKLLLGTASAVAMTGAAMAADLPVRAPLVAVPVFTWQGFYVGANVGYIDGNRTHTVGSPLAANPGIGGTTQGAIASAAAASGRGTDLSAILGGGGIGYNWQFGSIVAGVETDIQASSRSSETRGVNVPVPGFPGAAIVGSTSSSQRFNYIGTVRGRLGYTVLDNLLVYVTGGLAYGEKESRESFGFIAQGGNQIPPYGGTIGRSKTETGYTVGGGAEYMLDANWSVKAEALYYDLGKTQSSGQFNTGCCAVPPQFAWTTGVRGTTDNKGVIARFGVNYKFTTW